MIKNETQLRITKEQLEKFKDAFAQLILDGPGEKHPLQYQAEKDALLSMIDELRYEIARYAAAVMLREAKHPEAP